MRSALLFAMAAAASAFTGPTLPGAMQLRGNKAAVSMAMQKPTVADVKKAIAPAIAVANAVIAAPAFAEGTGEAFGIDDGRLILPLVLIPVLIGVAYGGFSGTQDNEDFFDTYDQRRK